MRGNEDALNVWIRRDLLKQFGVVEPVPEGLLKLIEAAYLPN